MNKYRLKELDSLRGIAVIFVMLFHFTYGYNHSDVNSIFHLGYLGVHLFFIISGFVIFMSLEKAENAKTFILSRISRLYPAYWAAILLNILLIFLFSNTYIIPNFVTTLGLKDLLVNLTMFQHWFNIKDVDGVFWTLAVELNFYIFMIILYKLKLLKNIERVGLILLVLMIGAKLINNPTLNLIIPLLLYGNLFFAGIIFYKIWKHKKIENNQILLLLSCWIVQFVVGTPTEFIASGIFFVIFYFVTQDKLKFLKWKSLAFVGTISYSLYLIHENVGGYLFNILDRIGIIQLPIKVIISTFALFGVATAITFLIEKPAMQFIRERKDSIIKNFDQIFIKLKNLLSNSEHESTKFLTGIRAYAALAIVFLHTGGFGLRTIDTSTSRDLGDRFVDYGKYGVIVFFVLSAFTIFMSIDMTKHFKYWKYLIRRLFRIMPLYIVMLGFIVFVLNYGNITTTLLKQFFFNATLLDLFNVGYRNSIIQASWTIPLEVAFYLVLPIIFFYINKNPNRRLQNFIMFGTLLTLLSATVTLLPYFNEADRDLVIHYSIERYIFPYVVGITLFYIFKRLKFNINSSLLIWHFLALIGYIVFVNQDEFVTNIFFSLWTAILILICISRSKLSRLIFENAVIQFLGTISYSIYICHYVLISYLHIDSTNKTFYGVKILVLAIVVSTFTYYFIEKPFIALGKRLTR